uniref:Uncharacterized protein n=1 Tax=Physcomitrium patens TaxID=3218 RepID=A0A2K1JJ77_PHYPA|nr:hypothetical protein PHYPA_019003 [Physcomitrium patens]
MESSERRGSDDHEESAGATGRLNSSTHAAPVKKKTLLSADALRGRRRAHC